MRIESGFAEVNGTKIYYEKMGTGNPLVLNHGNTQDRRLWDDQFHLFAEKYCVIRYDLRGCGYSDPPTGKYSYHEDLKALLDFLNIEKTYVLGLSVGGGISINFAIHYPEATAALIPVGPFITGYNWPQLSPFLQEIVKSVRRGEADRARTLWAKMHWFAFALRNPNVAPRLKQMLEDNSGWFFEKVNPVDWGKEPMTDHFGSINIPTLIIIGEYDSSDNHVVANALFERIPKARKVVIPDSGHIVNMEAPDQFNYVVLDFLERI